MKYTLFAAMLLLSSCDRPSAPAPKTAEPQREALQTAWAVRAISVRIKKYSPLGTFHPA